MGKINFCKSDELQQNSFCIGKVNAIDLNDGYSYALKIDLESVNIKGKTDKDAIRGFITLLQCICVYKQCAGNDSFLLPQLEIADKPVMEFRGIHLCVFPETPLKRLHKIIRFIALLKYRSRN